MKTTARASNFIHATRLRISVSQIYSAGTRCTKHRNVSGANQPVGFGRKHVWCFRSICFKNFCDFALACFYAQRVQAIVNSRHLSTSWTCCAHRNQQSTTNRPLKGLEAVDKVRTERSTDCFHSPSQFATHILASMFIPII